MAGKNALFRIMKAATGGALSGLTGLVNGEAIGTKVAALVTAFKDSSGNATFPQLNAAGQLPVTFDSGDCLHASGSLAGTATITEITGATITLTEGEYYRNVTVTVSAMTESCFELVYITDEGEAGEAETVLWRGQVGPGQYTVCCHHACIEFQAATGTTGAERLFIRGANANTDEAAELQATLSALTSSIAA